MCSLEQNIGRVNKFIDILKQVKDLVEETSPEIIPDEFWEDKINKVKEEIK